MIDFIAHRINTIDQLRKLPNEYGLELDLRDGLDGSLYMQHDPFMPGENFENFIQLYRHGTLILNVKSERIEYKVLELMEKYSIDNYFFLDSSFPMIKSLTDRGESKIALRFSEYEGLDTIRNMSGRAKWIWVDCFTKFPLTKEIANSFKIMGYKICIVSPELQAQPNKIVEYAQKIQQDAIPIDAVCTKVYNINKWKDLLSI